MSDNTLTQLYKHNLWANLKLLDACAELSPEQRNTTGIGTFGSIQKILEHIVTAEQSYFSRISTGKRYDAPEDAMTIDQMKEIAQQTGNGVIEWASKVQPEDTVEIDWDGTMRDVPKTILLTQVINHATEHREQIKTILTNLGIEPPDLQAWEYFAEISGF